MKKTVREKLEDRLIELENEIGFLREDIQTAETHVGFLRAELGDLEDEYQRIYKEAKR